MANGIKDFTHMQTGIILKPVTTDPTSLLVDGAVWINTTDDILRAYVGSATRDILTN